MENYQNLTWDDIKAMFAKTERISQETGLQIKETSNELKQFFKESKERQKDADRQLEETWKQINKTSRVAEETSRVVEETSRVVEETSREVKETSRKVAETTRQLGGLANSNGEVAESFFINSFENSMQFAGQEYDSIDSNLKRKSKRLNIRAEYDLVMYNCHSVAIIEIKYNADKYDIEQLLKKPHTFKQLFPEYANFDFLLGLAGLHIDENAEKEAIKLGIAVIKQVGKNLVINAAHLKVY